MKKKKLEKFTATLNERERSRMMDDFATKNVIYLVIYVAYVAASAATAALQ